MVAVTGEPTDATTSCVDRLVDDDGAGYVLDGPTKIQAATDVYGDVNDRVAEVTFDVRWQTDADPGLRICYLVVSRDDGTQDPPIKQNVLIGEHPVTFDVAGPAETIQDAGVECGPLQP